MTVAYSVTLEMRLKLKEPFGTLIRGSFSKTMDKLEDIVKKEKPPGIISVGDTVSRNLHEHRIIPRLAITDNKSMRKAIQPQTFPPKNLIQVKNPQGTITEEAIAAVRDALEGDKQVQILVDGEEDLLTLVAVLHAPENSLVIYGQPHEGIVVVKVTPEKKADVARILNAMKTVRRTE
jgi:uncharacterized protein (UPF0218 family)